MNDLDAFAELITALDPWRSQMILIGGNAIACTPRVYWPTSSTSSPTSPQTPIRHSLREHPSKVT